MAFISKVSKLLGFEKHNPEPLLPPPLPEPDEDEFDVPEIVAEALQTQLMQPESLHLLDVRENYEWNQVRMRSAQHIPMNDIPNRISELPLEDNIVVFCAHGQRSYGVAHYLIENGFDALSLAGGITDWAAKGYEVNVGPAAQEVNSE